MREKQPGVWKARALTANDARGRPTQISRTVRGSKRDAQRLAAQLEVGPGSAPPAEQSRVRSIKQDKIARIPIA